MIYGHITSLRLAKDSEIKQAKSGQLYAKAFGFARIGDNGLEEGESSWAIGLTAFGQPAQRLGKLKKGSSVSVAGELSQYTRADGSVTFNLLVSELITTKKPKAKELMLDEDYERPDQEAEDRELVGF